MRSGACLGFLCGLILPLHAFPSPPNHTGWGTAQSVRPSSPPHAIESGNHPGVVGVVPMMMSEDVKNDSRHDDHAIRRYSSSSNDNLEVEEEPESPLEDWRGRDDLQGGVGVRVGGDGGGGSLQAGFVNGLLLGRALVEYWTHNLLADGKKDDDVSLQKVKTAPSKDPRSLINDRSNNNNYNSNNHGNYNIRLPDEKGTVPQIKTAPPQAPRRRVNDSSSSNNTNYNYNNNKDNSSSKNINHGDYKNKSPDEKDTSPQIKTGSSHALPRRINDNNSNNYHNNYHNTTTNNNNNHHNNDNKNNTNNNNNYHNNNKNTTTNNNNYHNNNNSNSNHGIGSVPSSKTRSPRRTVRDANTSWRRSSVVSVRADQNTPFICSKAPCCWASNQC